jgi:hypothetical protein
MAHTKRATNNIELFHRAPTSSVDYLQLQKVNAKVPGAKFSDKFLSRKTAPGAFSLPLLKIL